MSRKHRPEPLVKVRIDPPKLPRVRLPRTRLLPRRKPRPQPLVKVRVDPPKLPRIRLRRPRLGPFRERNPVLIGAVGLTVLALLTAAAFNADRLPVIGDGETYSAAFAEAGGLKPGDEVRIAGVKVGKVEEVDLDGDHVKVTFKIKGEPAFGTGTGASIRVKTILGAKYLALHPRGRGRLEPGSEIPLKRTVPAYDVVQAFSDLTTTTEKVDTDRLAKALDTISTTFEDSPQEVRESIKGLSKISRTVASRDKALGELLDHANGVTGVLADRSGDFTALVEDGDKLFKEISKRRTAIHKLLKTSAALGIQLSGLVQDNEKEVGPALKGLNTVVKMLERNQSSLDRSIELLAPYVRVFTNTLGNGRWFDSYVQNLVAAPVVPRRQTGGAQ
ncbi:phospholipid/cholesterol/gamma-HCH transport system substrate-binding protein [Streptomyces sp. Ag82_O1-12]|uniref:MCE family protein n=1 Tax=unclassified Streptomyces TaxID=2593676 RepID=UPI000BD29A2C|nr:MULTISPECIES: MCE family protein [unclassified Streptomyces]SMQ15889.1 phospholipid/cholesterol/gamma-HCH transport system substrate-binding protein [Streptomyces sp. Ag82_O1-12]SOD44917.1 phospholipid/cholesterol/gamma-HCH transport system substrate-binding protein [Streptomyces sp. Ag82_G6-1]